MAVIRFPNKLTKEGFRRSSTLHPVFLSIKDELIPCSMASMILPEGENLAYRDFVRLYTSDGDMGIYMVTAPSDAYPGNPSITLCHAVCLLDDVRIRGSGTLSGTLGEVVQQILQQQTDESPLFTAGSFADSDINIRVEYDDDTLLSLIKTACTRAYDQRLTIDQTTTPWVIGSVSVPTTPTAEGRFTRNLESVHIDTDGDDQCTRLVVVHTDWSSGEKTYTTHDADTISQYGVIEDVWSVPYGATEEDVNAYIDELLRQRGEPTVSIDIDGYDLHTATGETLDGFDAGDLMRCCLPEYKTTVNARITTVEYPDVYGSPDARRVSLRNKTQTLADLLIEIKKEARRAGRGAGRAASAAAAARWGLTLTHEELEDMGDYWRHEFDVVGLRLDAEEALVQAHATNIETLFNDVGLLQTTTGTVQFDLDGMKREISLLAKQTTVDELTGEVESIGTTVTVNVDGLRATIQKNDETLSALNNTIAGLENWVTDGAENISELTNTVRGLQSTVSTVDGRVSDLTNTADGLTSVVMDQTDAFALLQTRINEVAANVQDANGNLGAFAVTAGSVAAKITAVDGRVGALGVTADEILGKVSDQSNAFAALSIRIDEISQSVQDANGALGQISVQAGRIAQTVSSADERLSSKLELLEGALNLEAQADGSVVSLRLNAVENRITAQANTISGISGDINRINNSINTITGSVLWQDRSKIVSAVGKVTTLEGDISTIKGSALWQDQANIAGVVGNMSVGADGKIYIKSGSGLMIQEGSTSYGVYTSNNLTAGVIVNKINGGTVRIKAANIELDGYVTANELQTEIARVDDLVSGTTEAKALKASLVDCVNTLKVEGYETAWRTGDFVTAVTFPVYRQQTLRYTDWNGERQEVRVLMPDTTTPGQARKGTSTYYISRAS